MKKELLIVAALCVSIAFVGCASFEKAAGEATTLNQLPKAVRVLVDNDLNGGRLVEAKRELRNNKEIYAVTYYDINRVLMKVQYLRDGTLVSKCME